MANQPNLPPWLRSPASRPSARSRNLAAARNAGAAVALLALGAAAGYFLHQPAPVAAPTPTPVACPEPPPPPVCADTKVRKAGPRHADAKKTRVAAAEVMQPLPEQQPMDENTRTQALRAFAAKKAPELRDCLAEPDRGPPQNLGAAFEIDAKGAVDSVQILGSEGSSPAVRTCYAKRLKRWKFPEELLRGEEKLLVNFVL